MFCVWIIRVKSAEQKLSFLPYPNNSLITLSLPAMKAQPVGSEMIFSLFPKQVISSCGHRNLSCLCGCPSNSTPCATELKEDIFPCTFLGTAACCCSHDHIPPWNHWFCPMLSLFQKTV